MIWRASCFDVLHALLCTRVSQTERDVGISASVKSLTSPWPLVALSLIWGRFSRIYSNGLVQQATRKFLCKRNKRRNPARMRCHATQRMRTWESDLLDWLGMRAWLHTYKAIIVPSVSYGCETWPLTLGDEHRVRSRIFWSKWGKTHNLNSSPSVDKTKEVQLDGICGMHKASNKCVQKFNLKTWWDGRW